MSVPFKYRQLVVRTGFIGLGTYVLYKLIAPSEEHLRKFHEDPDERKIGINHNRLARVVELSKQGYSYEAICKIVSIEKKKRYEQLYIEERENKLREERDLAASAKSSAASASFCLDSGLNLATKTIIGAVNSR